MSYSNLRAAAVGVSVLITVGAAFSIIGLGSGAGQTPSDGSSTPDGTTPVAAGANLVTIDNFTFTPQSLAVPAGASVKWVNRDDVPHTIKGVSQPFKSQALDTDDEFSFTFTKAGEYSYFCGIHPHMTGKIVVK